MGEAIDLTGQRFGKLVVKGKTEKRDASGCVIWLCECDCGKKSLSPSGSLTAGHKTSCGCKRKHDLTGKKFGNLYVIERASNKGKKVAWRCKCSCGKETITTTYYLLSGQTKSCGCLRVKHNGVGTRLYGIWRGIRNRCENLNSHVWGYYGGKGIKICDEWRDSFVAFRKWALANGYNGNLQIDRIESGKHYQPDNCRWVLPKVNSRNRKGVKLNKKKVANIKSLIKGGIDLNEIAEMYNVNINTLRDILNGRTWTDVKCS